MHGAAAKMVPILIVLVSLIFTIVRSQTSALEDEEMVLLHFPDDNDRPNREINLLEDLLKVQIAKDDGQFHNLHLEKQSQINTHLFNIRTDNVHLNAVLKDHTNKDSLTGFYQDLESMAAVSVRIDFQHPGIKIRYLQETLLIDSAGYELYPATEKQGASLITKRGLDSTKVHHHVYVLKKVNLSTYYHPLKSTPSGTQAFERMLNKQLDFNAYKSGKDDNLNNFLSETDERKRSQHFASIHQDIREFHVELQFIVDVSIYNFWVWNLNAKEDQVSDVKQVIEAIKFYYTHIINGMHMCYRQIDYSKHAIKIAVWLADMFIITQKDSFLAPAYFGNELLNVEFALQLLRQWMKDQGYDWSFPDHVQLWTKKTLTSEGESILGASYECGVCEPGYQLSVNKDCGFFSWVTASHELGHNLGSSHDGEGGNGCLFNKGGKIFIMASTAFALNDENVEFALTFSDCSIDQIKKCLLGHENPHSAKWPRVCVYDKKCAHEETLTSSDLLPGEVFDLHAQCRLFVEEKATFTDNCWSHDICKRMYCSLSNGSRCNESSSVEFRAAVGSRCHPTDENMVCFDGKCVNKTGIKAKYLASDSLQQKCGNKSLTAPPGCENKVDSVLYSNHNIPCDKFAQLHPWFCFLHPEVRSNCAESCYKYGLFYVDNPWVPQCVPPEAIPNTTATTSYHTPNLMSTTSVTPMPIITTSDLTIIHCDSKDSKRGGVRCPLPSTLCTPMEWFCDGIADCPNATDENPDICRQIPCPFDGYVRCKTSLNACVKESELCDTEAICPDESDEDIEWCKIAPRYCLNRFSSHYSSYNCPNDLSQCVSSQYICDGSVQCSTTSSNISNIANNINDETPIFCQTVCSLEGAVCSNSKGKQKHYQSSTETVLKKSWLFKYKKSKKFQAHQMSNNWKEGEIVLDLVEERKKWTNGQLNSTRVT